MSDIHVRRIRARLTELFAGLVDLSDWSSHPEEIQERVLLSRSLAAYVLTVYSGLSPEEAARRITDGGDDNGIDALHFSEHDRVLYLIQSKWIDNGRGGPNQADVIATINGFLDLIREKFERFNSKIQARMGYIKAALDDANAKIMIVFVHTGESDISAHARRRLEDVAGEVNDPAEILRYKVLKQKDIHEFIASETSGPPINLEVAIQDWGTLQDPNVAYYGLVSAADIAVWYDNHGPRLFAQNLRHLIPESDVNSSIIETLKSTPDSFWYFNNGITVVCDSITKKPRGGSDRRQGEFVCNGISVVNGAQTVGCIGAVAQGNRDSLSDALVAVRFIAVGSSASDFARSVTRATNTQNRINARDFVALDRQQARLQVELALDGHRYAYKTGEADPPEADGCSVVEASVALACAQGDPDLAVQAKREIGRLWQDISRPPYTQLFNEQVSAARLWRSVSVMRIVGRELERIQRDREGRERSVAIHGNRLILHLVFSQLSTRMFDASGFDQGIAEENARELTLPIALMLLQEIEDNFPNSYLASLFKNARKCRLLAEKVKQGTAALLA